MRLDPSDNDIRAAAGAVCGIPNVRALSAPLGPLPHRVVEPINHVSAIKEDTQRPFKTLKELRKGDELGTHYCVGFPPQRAECASSEVQTIV